MIENIKIENFKSVQSLEMELGRMNIIIGENGSGKTNILEAIAMASAASQDKLDHEFLASRGIRVTEPELMRSGFDIGNTDKFINIHADTKTSTFNSFLLSNENKQFSKWVSVIPLFKLEIIKTLLTSDNNKEIETTENLLLEIDETKYNDLISQSREFRQESKGDLMLEKTTNIFLEKFKQNQFDFLIYCPENSALRNFYQEGQIQPLGIKGEGLFRLLTVFAEQGEPLQELKENLQLIDWFDDFEVKGNMFGERSILIRDRFLDDELAYFSQRSANEGFLYLMFYFALFISPDTPKFFAVDNIENALNPKLCRKLIPLLFKLAEKHDKQVIFTTHNPAILDGLDLKNDQQRLFVARRNKLGHTKINRVEYKAALNGHAMKLSEAFMEGHLGGIPTHF